MRARLLRAAAAVAGGNVLYFLVAWRLLPESARHRPFALDLGLGVDFAICAALYGLLGLVFRRPRR